MEVLTPLCSCAKVIDMTEFIQPPTQRIAEQQPLPADFLAQLTTQLNAIDEFGTEVTVNPDALVYNTASLEEVYALATLINGIIESNVIFQGTDTISGLMPGEGVERNFTAFCTTSLDREQLETNTNQIIAMARTDLELLQSPFRI